MASLIDVDEDAIPALKPKTIDQKLNDILDGMGAMIAGNFLPIGDRPEVFTNMQQTPKTRQTISSSKPCPNIGVHVSVENLDRHPYSLVCKNGVIDLKTGELLPFSRDF